ncbi:hypothetical protein JXB02_04620 [Candidatus Woesearchaeota archaeon]|nr:hypothetical protein [Candidatus Woesearchaeota archaeon]
MRPLPIMLMLILLPFVAGCGEGRLEVTKLEYLGSFNVSQFREFPIYLEITNTGSAPCTVANIYSDEFWKISRPGLTGNLNVVFDTEILPRDTQGFEVIGYVWDADTIADSQKEFRVVVLLAEEGGCAQGRLEIGGSTSFVT